MARAFALNNIMGNIVLFVPFGVYLILLNSNKKISVNVCVIAFISAAAETAQYLFRVGAADIEKVICERMEQNENNRNNRWDELGKYNPLLPDY